ncbi:MAG: nucleoside deaminase [Phycisphaerae bacterium]|nr:nucleoside deaminase [Phycisphaerae bacterium]
MPIHRMSSGLPEWTEAFLRDQAEISPNHEDRMRLVIHLARLNVEHRTGGPFAAAIFQAPTGRLLSVGVNRVVPLSCSIAHAEVLAIISAHQRVEHHDLGREGMPAHELVTSTEPCAMCMGAIIWSGVRAIVCGARDEDVRQIGFDEGPKLEDWPSAFEQRGIAVTRDVLRHEAAAVLRQYAESGGPIYNSRQGPSG